MGRETCPPWQKHILLLVKAAGHWCGEGVCGTERTKRMRKRKGERDRRMKGGNGVFTS